jgi:hypothetical protein
MLDGQHQSECNHKSSKWRKSHEKIFKKIVILPQLWPIFAELDTEADKKYLYDNSDLADPKPNSLKIQIEFSEIKKAPANNIIQKE